MIIVYVIDVYGEYSNGTSITAVRTREKLVELGHTVRVVSVSRQNGKDYYSLEIRKIPIVSRVSAKQGIVFAKSDKNIFREAFKDADVVHFFLPWKSAKVAIKIAREMNIPVTGSYHTAPENITYGAGLGKYGKPTAWVIYKVFKNRVYSEVDRVHCPSEMIVKRLRKYGYKNIFHPITNGVTDKFFVDVKRPLNPETFTILSVGRLAPEKRHEITLKAVSHSKYKNKIKVVLAGAGPKKKYLESLGKKYNINLTVQSYNQDDLLKVMESADLFVHAAEIEVEGMSVLESLATGLVPVLSLAPLSAPGQTFALTDKSTFKLNDYKELSEKIDYWIEHPEERLEMSKKYQEFMRSFHIDFAVKRLEEMFKLAVYDKQTLNMKRDKKDKYVKAIKPHPVKKFFVNGLIVIFMPLIRLFWYLFKGLRIKNKKNFKLFDGPCVVVSNHVHNYDSVMGTMATYPRLATFVSLPMNFENKAYGGLVKFFGAIPIPMTVKQTKLFLGELTQRLKKGQYVHFFPEGMLTKENPELNEFKRGAFALAENAMVPVMPIRFSFLKIPKKNGKKYKKRIILNVGTPIYPNIHMLRKDAIEYLREESYKQMVDLKVTSYKGKESL